jgi:hypothetical protein
MTIEERTERYITRRVAELRGDRSPSLMDEVTTKYIAFGAKRIQGPFISAQIDPPIKETYPILHFDEGIQNPG